MAQIDAISTSGEGTVYTVHLDLDKDAAKEMRKFRPGNVIQVSIVGTICSMNFRKPDDPDEKGYEGSVCLDIRSMDFRESSKNAMAELLDDDE